MDQVKFLVIRFSSIGDIVLTSPVVRLLKTRLDQAEVHYLTKAAFRNLVDYNPYIDKVHAYDGNFDQLIRTLKEENFDYIIDLHSNLRTMRVKNNLHRIAFTIKKLNIRKWLYVRFKWNVMPDIHIVDRYLQTLKLFDVKNDQKGLDYFFAPAADHIESLPTSLKNGFLTVVLGANHYTKQVPVDMLADILNRVNKPAVLLGGKDDVLASNTLETDLKIPVLNLCGQLSIDGSAAYIKNSKAVLTPDTGMMHIAAALHKPIVSVWGNTTPELGMYPYMPGQPDRFYIAEVNNLSCRPCSKIGFKKCPQKHFHCMRLQNTEKIVNQLLIYWNTDA